MRRAVQDGHTPRPLQEKARSRSCPQSVHRTRAKPWARMPHRRWPRKSPPPTGGRPSPWGRRPAPRQGMYPGDAGPPGTGGSRWGGGGDRPGPNLGRACGRGREGKAVMVASTRSAGTRVGSGPCPSLRRTQGRGHGAAGQQSWISTPPCAESATGPPPAPTGGGDSAIGRDREMAPAWHTRRKRSGKCWQETRCRSGWLRGPGFDSRRQADRRPLPPPPRKGFITAVLGRELPTRWGKEMAAGSAAGGAVGLVWRSVERRARMRICRTAAATSGR